MLVLPKSTPGYVTKEAGGKGLNLYLMSRLGLSVPDWVVVGRSTFDGFLRASGLDTRIDAALAAFAGGTATAPQTADTIADMIGAQELTAAARAAGESAYQLLTAPHAGGVGSVGRTSEGGPFLISVRSSAIDEDSPGHSFAGQLSSFLYLASLDDALRAMRSCWASAFSERGLAYRREHGLALRGISVAVVFQRMIDPDQSGVLFTCDPMANASGRFVVSAVHGVGEGLVSGALDADTYWLAANGGEVLDQDIADKREAFRRGAGGEGCGREALPESMRRSPCLSREQLTKLHGLGRKLHDFYGRPQDVEWAFKGGDCYVLQTRPITALATNTQGYPNLWDNSNIVESYGGLTSPLSFTFALRNYKNVYIQFCEILGLSRQVVKDMEYYLGNMLGSVKGRVFYNLYNWYKLVGVLPGFHNNRQFMETMMGVGEQLDDETLERIQPHPSWNTWRGRIRRFRTGVAFFYYHLTIQKLVDDFLRRFHRDYERFRALDYERMSSDRIFQLYLEVDQVMLNQWRAPIINDFLCMVHFGVLKKLTTAWLGMLGTSVQNDLLAGEGNLESAEPTKCLIRLAGEVVANTRLRALIEGTPSESLLEALNQSEHQDFYQKIQSYIDRFGFRCMSEMKLEERDLYADPSFLFACLKNYLRAGTTDLAAYEARERKLRADAEQAVRGALRGWRAMVYNWSLKHARRAVKNRENTRFARTRAYGIGRRMFWAMGRELSHGGVLSQPADIFYLTLEEVFGIHQGTLVNEDLRALVAGRQREYGHFAAEEPKIRFLTRGPVYWRNPILAVADQPDVEPGADYHLRGLPCCPGIVEGVVKVVGAVTDDLNLNGEILVASRTDPGWVPLYPSISGLLVERGSLLSHSAIVAREMGLPTIVGIKALTATLKSGMRIKLDGARGTVTILGAEEGE